MSEAKISPLARGEHLRNRGEKRSSDMICVTVDRIESKNKQQCHPDATGISLICQTNGRTFRTSASCEEDKYMNAFQMHNSPYAKPLASHQS